MKTVTAIKARSELFQKQFNQTTLVLLQSSQHAILKFHKELKESKVPLKQVKDVLVTLQTNAMVYNKFYNSVKDAYPFLEDLIELIVTTQVEFLKLEDFVTKNEFGTYLKEPMHLLWLFILRLFYEKPRLLLDETDDRDGTNTNIFRNSLSDFIADCINLRFRHGTSLTASSLKTFSEMDNRSEAGEAPPPMKKKLEIQPPIRILF